MVNDCRMIFEFFFLRFIIPRILVHKKNLLGPSIFFRLNYHSGIQFRKKIDAQILIKQSIDGSFGFSDNHHDDFIQPNSFNGPIHRNFFSRIYRCWINLFFDDDDDDDEWIFSTNRIEWNCNVIFFGKTKEEKILDEKIFKQNTNTELFYRRDHVVVVVDDKLNLNMILMMMMI